MFYLWIIQQISVGLLTISHLGMDPLLLTAQIC